jgi:ATP-dependent helicase HrpB
VSWDSVEGRVVAREEERLDAITLASRPVTPSREEVCAALVRGIVAGPGLAALNWTPQASQFRARVIFLARQAPEKAWPDFSTEWLTVNLAEWLGPYLAGVRSLEGLARVDLLPPLKAQLSWEQQRLLDEGTPTHLTVPSGSRISLDYAAEMPPVLAVKLQEMFGLGDTPTVAWGRVPVLIHLLSPARRPIQVTRDLRGFWNSTYQEVKKELKGRYPKHPWPDDPWNAPPAKGTMKRGKGE